MLQRGDRQLRALQANRHHRISIAPSLPHTYYAEENFSTYKFMYPFHSFHRHGEGWFVGQNGTAGQNGPEASVRDQTVTVPCRAIKFIREEKQSVLPPSIHLLSHRSALSAKLYVHFFLYFQRSDKPPAQSVTVSVSSTIHPIYVSITSPFFRSHHSTVSHSFISTSIRSPSRLPLRPLRLTFCCTDFRRSAARAPIAED